ncbi:MAG TPA: S1 RNA-binding domain-containing protein [Ktedonobacteraceae bacterium]|nr:S1 RNA-binding domain-containing protein [Ktedonobacteraceae bacterium]
MQVRKHGDLSTMPAANFKSGRVQTMYDEGNDPAEQNNNMNSEDMGEITDMAALLAESTTPINIKRGDVVEGVIVRIDQDEILVDIGLKSEGVLSTKELPASGYGSFNELHLNDKVLVYVIQPETPDGHALLSLKRANAERQWRIAEEQYKNAELLKARVIDYNKGGLIVDVSGIRGFVPISQILNLKREEVASGGDNQETAAKLASMKDKELQLKIIEINRARNRLILSERLAVQEWRQRRREELLDELKPGDIRRGIVSNLANFGAFIDLGGADGLVHISQLAWSRVNHPSEVLKVGQEVEVQVLSVDKDKKKIALSIKRAEVDPWTTVEQRYKVGQVVTGTITKIAPFGAFARIEDGIEGLIHLSELTPGMDPKANLHEGQQLQLRILRIDADRRRLGLSLRQADELDTKETTAEAPAGEAEAPAPNAASDLAGMTLEDLPVRPEGTPPTAEKEKETSPSSRRESRGERRERQERTNENRLLGNLPMEDEGETTAMAEAFRAAARQRSKEETEDTEE